MCGGEGVVECVMARVSWSVCGGEGVVVRVSWSVWW